VVRFDDLGSSAKDSEKSLLSAEKLTLTLGIVQSLGNTVFRRTGFTGKHLLIVTIACVGQPGT
jgi:hypothetical protein